jgi:glutaconate CoA-transferase subunit B
VAGALASLSVADVFAYVIEGGRVDTAFVGAAEIDRQGRLNTTVIGEYGSPKVRLPGSGGACEILDRARRVIAISPLEPRSFPEAVTFVTSAPRSDTELLVVSDRGVLTRGAGDTELRLTSVFEGETAESVKAGVGWELQVADDLVTEPDGD